MPLEFGTVYWLAFGVGWKTKLWKDSSSTAFSVLELLPAEGMPLVAMVWFKGW